MSEWLPIETAPRDDARFLGIAEDGFVEIFYWSPDNAALLADNGDFPVSAVTHWMPLPPPPTGKAER